MSDRATVSIGNDRDGWYWFVDPPKDTDLTEWRLTDKDKSARARTYDEILQHVTMAGYEVNNGGWKQKLLMWNWHSVGFDRYPGWAIEHGSPPWCRIEHVNGDTWKGGKRATDRKPTKSSSNVANAWDDLAEAQFYTRDISYDGSCSVMNREPYGSLWWFRAVAERDRFLAWLTTYDAGIKVVYRNAGEIPPDVE